MYLKNLVIAALLLGLAACSKGELPTDIIPTQLVDNETASPLPSQAPTTATPTLPPSRLLTICLLNEPRSLFLYDAISTSEQAVLAAIYDGPIDIRGYTPRPVILDKMPSLSDGSAALQSVEVNIGDMIVDAQGNLNTLGDGSLYRPSGCSQQACAQSFSGTGPVQMDQLILHFKLLPGLQWSDGEPLTAGDSVYSYEIVRNLFQSAAPGQVSRTASYTALDDLTVEWVGVPGFVDGQYQAKFFSPLPQHAWSDIPLGELSSSEISSRKPLGWGAYVIDEWVKGDHITLHANPLYFRASEGLPYFNNLVYRFVSNIDEAQSAVLAGECDLVEQAAGLETQTASLLQLRDEGRISLVFQDASAWDVLEFGISSLDEERPAFFASREARQAVAMCIDKEALVSQLSGGQLQTADMYIPASHPLYNSEVEHYAYDPQAAAELLSGMGWLDVDDDPSTPRVAQAVAGIADGTAFTVQLLVSDDESHQASARLIQENLGQCGIQVAVVTLPVEDFLAAGPDGTVFGRQFDLAQFAWLAADELPCSLYLTSEIPAAYPLSPKGWGGVNASGYSNPQYDAACLDALYSLADMPQHQEKHFEAQAIFAMDLPALPLYWHYRVTLGRPDICGVQGETPTDNIFMDLELFNYGENCP